MTKRKNQLDLLDQPDAKGGAETRAITTIDHPVLCDRLDLRQEEGRDIEKALKLVTGFMDNLEKQMYELKEQHLELKKQINQEHNVFIPLGLRVETKEGTPSRSVYWMATH